MKYAYGTGAVILTIIAFLLEIDIILHNPWQILNPYMQFIVVIRFLSAPAVWVVLPFTALFGYLAAKRS